MLFATLAVPSMAASAPAPKIVIAGAGLHGSALAYYLTQRGIKPIVVEQHSVAACADTCALGLRTVRTGYAYQPPACCTYQRHRTACPEAPRTVRRTVPRYAVQCHGTPYSATVRRTRTVPPYRVPWHPRWPPRRAARVAASSPATGAAARRRSCTRCPSRCTRSSPRRSASRAIARSPCCVSARVSAPKRTTLTLTLTRGRSLTLTR